MRNTTHNPKFYRGSESPCGYLDGLTSRSLVVNPFNDPCPDLYTSLIKQGFRRSGSMIYRPDCINCNRCIPVRLRVEDFINKRRFRRTLSKSADVTLKVVQSGFTDEYFSLYQRYLAAKHPGGSMTNPSEEDFCNFLVTENWPNSVFIEFRIEEKLMSVAVTDVVDDGLSCVYTFYNPDERRRAPGQLAILKQIQMTLDYELSYLYLGYWIKESAKMSYKANYQPLQYFYNNQWISKAELEVIS